MFNFEGIQENSLDEDALCNEEKIGKINKYQISKRHNLFLRAI